MGVRFCYKLLFIPKKGFLYQTNLVLGVFTQGKLKQGKAHLALKNLKSLVGDQKKDSLTSLEVCNLK